MAGIFDPTIQQGSSMSGESFVPSPVGGAGEITQAALGLYGTAVTARAEHKINKTQQDFLQGTADNRRDKAEIASLEDVSPTEGAAYQDARSKINSLNAAIKNRAINPSEALTRIESAKKQAKALAPSFSSQIDRLSGSGGGGSASFDEETSQLIGEVNIMRDEAAKAFLDPDNPRHVAQIAELKQTERRAKLLSNQQEIFGIEASGQINNMIFANMDVVDSQLNHAINLSGSVDNIPRQDLNQMITHLTSFTGNGARNKYARMIAQAKVDIGLIPDNVQNNQVKMLQGWAETKIKQLDGSVPKEVSDNYLTASKNNAWLKIKDTSPGLFDAMVMGSSVPGDSVTGVALNEVLGGDVAVYMENLGVGDLSRLSKSGIVQFSNSNPKDIQNQAALNFEKSLDWIKNNSSTASPALVDGHFNLVNNQIQAIDLSPSEFSPKVFTAMMDHVNSPEVTDFMNKANPELMEQVKSNTEEMILSFVDKNLSVAIANDMAETFSARGRRGAFLKDFITPTIDDRGQLKFLMNTGIADERSKRKLEQEVKRLTRKYSPVVSKVGYTLTNISDQVTRENSREVLIATMQDAFSSAGVPLRESASALTKINSRGRVVE
jgi:hypothetical protein